MQTDKLGHWIGLVANVGVLIGIAALIYELNQNRHLLRAELGSRTIELQFQIDMARIDDGLSDALSNAIHSRKKLTNQQLIKIDAYLEASILKLYLEAYLIQLEVFPNAPNYLIEIFASSVMRNRIARTWWTERKKSMKGDPLAANFVSLLDEAIEQVAPDGDLQRLNAWRSQFENSQGTEEDM